MKLSMLPQELEVWYVLPALRRELAIEMKKKGLTQTKIAELLNVTKPAITQYIKKSRAKEVKLDKISADIVKGAKRIQDGEPLVRVLNSLLKVVRESKLICSIHQQCCDDELSKCEVCYK